jgi:peptide-methionine (S)-S-oxide reductase
MNERIKIGFGGGCHWCTESVFKHLKGLVKVRQGYISSVSPFNSFSEAIIVSYNPLEIKLYDLIEVHLNTHASIN